jgi:hypothetical protein
MEIQLTAKGMILCEALNDVATYEHAKFLLNAYEAEYGNPVFDLMLRNMTPAEALASIKNWAVIK